MPLAAVRTGGADFAPKDALAVSDEERRRANADDKPY